MNEETFVLGIDLGTTGVRIAVINRKKELIHTAASIYKNGIEKPKDWENCCEELISNIPINIKKYLKAISVDGTSGTLIACNQKGEPLGDAIPYNKCFPEKKILIDQISNHCLNGRFDSLERGLHLIDKYGCEILLRHQADWINGWLIEDWQKGEEGNNIKLGWDLIKHSWPKYFYNQDWLKTLPKIISSGKVIAKISLNKAKSLKLPENLILIAGTTDSNAGFIASNASEDEGVTVLGSTIVIKKIANQPLIFNGISNHQVGGKWIIGGASNTGGCVLKKFFSDEELDELSKQINPGFESGIDLFPLASKGERFPINDDNLMPILTPRPTSDALYLHALLEGLAKIEKQGWEKLHKEGITYPKRIITIGKGALNFQWQKIREKIIGIPIKKTSKPTAMGVAMIALEAIKLPQS
tara:strand:+ start:4070 stop:5311 length:1242 start_codon:yes stop_codon:yes gene_type:complete